MGVLIVVCFVVRYFMSILVLMGKRKIVALLVLSSWCLVIAEWPFLAVPWVCLRFVILVFPDHTHLLFLSVLGGCSYLSKQFFAIFDFHFVKNKLENLFLFASGVPLASWIFEINTMSRRSRSAFKDQ